MVDEKQPRRNFFDVIAGWLGRDEGRKAGRGRLAQLFAFLGTLFALLQLLFSTLDLANRAVASVLSWLPYLIPALFIAGAAASIYFLVTATDRPQRLRATAALALIVIVGAGWGGWSYYQATRPPKAVIVVVADFDGQAATKGVDWGRRIYERVKDQVARLELGDRVEEQRVFESYADSEAARKGGAARKATVVLWGWYDDVGVSPHFELLRAAQKFAPSLAALPQDLTDFDLYVRSGPQEMAYIVAVALGLVHYADGNYAAAEHLFTSALTGAPASSELLGLDVPHFYRATARYFSYQPPDRPMDGIVADLQESISLRPDFWQAHWNLALIYTAYCTPTLTLDAALAEAEQVRGLQPERADAYWLLGQIRSQREEWPEAEAAYRQALQRDPTHADAQEGLANALEKQDRADEARLAYQRALELRQEAAQNQPKRGKGTTPEAQAEAQDKLGYAYLQTGDYDRAIALFQEALAAQPANATYHRRLGNGYYWQGKPDPLAPSAGLDRAIAEYETARGLDPYGSLLLTVLGGAYEEAGRPEDALAAYEAAVKAAACDPEAVFLLAGQYDKMERPADAEAAFRRLAELDPDQAVAWQWLATAAFVREDYAAAADAYRAGVAADPQSAELQYGLAASLYHLEDYAGAEAGYRQAVALAPEDALALLGWGDSLDRLGRTSEAITAYERAVALAPDYLSWMSLGFLYERADRLDDAAAAFGEAAAIRPEDALAHAAHGRLLQRLGQYETAGAAYELAVRYEPANASYWETLMLNYAALNRGDDALRAAAETLARNPRSALAYLVRGGIDEDRGDRQAARAAYESALALAGENDALKQLVEAALERVGE